VPQNDKMQRTSLAAEEAVASIIWLIWGVSAAASFLGAISLLEQTLGQGMELPC